MTYAGDVTSLLLLQMAISGWTQEKKKYFEQVIKKNSIDKQT